MESAAGFFDGRLDFDAVFFAETVYECVHDFFGSVEMLTLSAAEDHFDTELVTFVEEFSPLFAAYL